jgi:hypothetical protein
MYTIYCRRGGGIFLIDKGYKCVHGIENIYGWRVFQDDFYKEILVVPFKFRMCGIKYSS